MNRAQFCAFVKKQYGVGRNRGNHLFDLIDKDNSGIVEQEEIESLAANAPPSLLESAIYDVDLWCALIFLMIAFGMLADLFIESIVLVTQKIN